MCAAYKLYLIEFQRGTRNYVKLVQVLWLTWRGWGFCVPASGCCCLSGRAPVAWQAASRAAGSQSAHYSLDPQATNVQNTHERTQAKHNHALSGQANKSRTSLTLISGRLRISGKTVMWLECAMRVCSLLQLDTVEGMVFSLLPLRLSSSSCSSLLNLLKTHK